MDAPTTCSTYDFIDMTIVSPGVAALGVGDIGTGVCPTFHCRSKNVFAMTWTPDCNGPPFLTLYPLGCTEGPQGFTGPQSLVTNVVCDPETEELVVTKKIFNFDNGMLITISDP
jgi:hypothetical protein